MDAVVKAGNAWNSLREAAERGGGICSESVAEFGRVFERLQQEA